jgi:hypothetical protein
VIDSRRREGRPAPAIARSARVGTGHDGQPPGAASGAAQAALLGVGRLGGQEAPCLDAVKAPQDSGMISHLSRQARISSGEYPVRTSLGAWLPRWTRITAGLPAVSRRPSPDSVFALIHMPRTAHQ